MATESEVMAAVLAAVNAVMPATKQATEPSKVATSRPPEHTTVTLVERPGGTGRSGHHSTRGWQVYIFAASSTSEANARNSLEKAHGALVNRVLTIGAEQTTPIALGPGRPVGEDDGWFSGSKSYTFAL